MALRNFMLTVVYYIYIVVKLVDELGESQVLIFFIYLSKVIFFAIYRICLEFLSGVMRLR